MHLLFVAALMAGTVEPPEAASSVIGRWINPDHTVIVEIGPCDADLCGTVQWATEQAQQDARKGIPNLIGSQILTGLQQDGDMWKGHLFVPDENLHAEAKIEADGDQLKVSGCEIGICKSQLWARTDGQVPPSN